MMAYLHILGSGKSAAEIANSKGHLFERLIRKLFESLKMTVTHLNVSRNGKEIDAEGRTLVGNVPFFAECKSQEDPLNSGDIQMFGYKFMMRKANEPDLRGFVYTLSPLNTKAEEVWREELEKTYHDAVHCYGHDAIVELMIDHYGLASPVLIRNDTSSKYGRECGDTQLLCIEGPNNTPALYWAQLLMSQDGTEPSAVVLHTAVGTEVTEKGTIDNLLERKPDLCTAKLICLNRQNALPTVDDISPSRSVVRIRMSSDWFDYRLPADPRFHVGRDRELEQIRALVDSIRSDKTGIRSFIVSGKSGIGKSSLALKARSLLQDQAVVFLPVDSRLCDDISFVFDCVNELLAELREAPGLASGLVDVQVRGLDSLTDTLAEIDQALRAHGYLAVLFFDQFERVFEHSDVTRAIRTLLLRLAERRMAVVFGFAWKSDLWSLAEGFPHTERDDIVRESDAVRALVEFRNEETSEILKHLETQWGGRMNTVLHRQLAAFSRGLPWLLKKVCAHVLDQKARGVSESELIETNLNLQDLFEADLAGLDAEDRSLLQAIAPLLPATLRRLSESFEISNIDRSLHRFIDKRILVKITEDIGDSVADVKYDAYSDIFREFLTTGRAPFDDAYCFYTYPRGSLKFFQKIRDRGSLSIDEEIAETGKQIASIYNLSRDLRSLGLVNLRNRVFSLTEDVCGLAENELVKFLQSMLKRNRVVSQILSELNESGRLSSNRLSELLQELFPSVQASDSTWRYYARTTAAWIHQAHLAYKREESLHRVDDEAVFESIVDRGHYRVAGYRLPTCFRNAIVLCLSAVNDCDGKCDIRRLMGMMRISHQSVEKAVSDNINLGFVAYDEADGSYSITAEGVRFIGSSESARRQVFRERCEQLDVFKHFVEQLRAAGLTGTRSAPVAEKIAGTMGLQLAELTLQKLGMILVNWAEYAGVAKRSGTTCYLAEHAPETRQMKLNFRQP